MNQSLVGSCHSYLCSSVNRPLPCLLLLVSSVVPEPGTQGCASPAAHGTAHPTPAEHCCLHGCTQSTFHGRNAGGISHSAAVGSWVVQSFHHIENKQHFLYRLSWYLHVLLPAQTPQSPLTTAELVFLTTHRNVDSVAQSLLFLALKQPAKLMGLKDFSLLKTRLCQHEYTHTFEPTLILFKLRKTQLPLPLLLLSYAKSTKHRTGVKHSRLLTGMLLPSPAQGHPVVHA